MNESSIVTHDFNFDDNFDATGGITGGIQLNTVVAKAILNVRTQE